LIRQYLTDLGQINITATGISQGAATGKLQAGSSGEVQTRLKGGAKLLPGNRHSDQSNHNHQARYYPPEAALLNNR
jgi:hypothetical protein